MENVLGVAEFGIRRNRCEAPAAALVGGDHGGQPGRQGKGLGAVGGGAAVVLGGILRAEEADGGAQNVHGVAGAGQPAEQLGRGAVQGAHGAFGCLELPQLDAVG
ncbi:hypothetical protein GCM10010277_77580 [Streptomyces longisporoflavus]|nr:hypothetical protein GCM10010277_77580 [Streptomyces longisporoflavus]